MHHRMDISDASSAPLEPRHQAANRAATASHRAEQKAAKATPNDGQSGSRFLLPVLLVAQLMVILDITAVNIAMPNLARDLHISGATISWTITAYSLVFGSLLLLGGRAADMLGRRRMFLTGLGSSRPRRWRRPRLSPRRALRRPCGTGPWRRDASPRPRSPSSPALPRNGAGEGARRMGRGRRCRCRARRARRRLLTQLADWRLIFFVNLPVAAALAYAARRIAPADTRSPVGAVSTSGCRGATASMAAIVYAITQADRPAGSVQTIGMAARPIGLVPSPRRAAHRASAAADEQLRDRLSAAACCSAWSTPASCSGCSCSARSTCSSRSATARSRAASRSSRSHSRPVWVPCRRPRAHPLRPPLGNNPRASLRSSRSVPALARPR